MVTLSKIVIKSSAISSFLVSDYGEHDDAGVSTEEVTELKNLAEAVNENHDGLNKVLRDRTPLESTNEFLKECDDIVQHVEARYPGGCIRFSLKDGDLNKNGINECPSWFIRPLEGENRTIPLCCLKNVSICLADVRCSNPVGPLQVAQMAFTENFTLILRFSHDIAAFFHFDESLGEVDLDGLPGGFMNYVHDELSRPDVAANDQGLTMTFLALEINVWRFKKHLDAIGVDTNNDHQIEE